MEAGTKQQIKIQPISETDRNEVVNILRLSFYKDEPLCLSLNLIDGKESTNSILDKHSINLLSEGVNLKATIDGKIAGVVLNSILTKEDAQEVENPNTGSEKLNRILNFLNKVFTNANVFGKFPSAEKAVYVKIVTVCEGFRGLGIAKALLRATSELGVQRGCNLMFSDCTSYYSSLAMERIGLNCVYSLKYSDYRENGEVVFETKEPHLEVKTYAKTL